MDKEALSAPGCPLACTAEIPATRAPMILLIPMVGALRISLSETVDMAAVRLPRF